MYTISDYGKMIADPLRMQAYTKALESVIEPGAVVLDLGAGTGIFALIACKLGARRVYAVEPSESIQVARELAEANGFGDRTEFIQGRSTDITLSEPADVVVSDLRDILPVFGRHIPDIIDVRQRLLSPDGILIPARDTLQAALVESDELYRSVVTPWQATSYGLDMSIAKKHTANTCYKARVEPDRLITDPKPWAILDYTSIDSADVLGSLEWNADRSGTAHGVLIWFDAELAEGASFSNAPDEPELIYQSAFFPLEETVQLAEGDRISLILTANLVGGDYLWRWEIRVAAAGETDRSKVHLSQSTFYSRPVTPEQLRKSDVNHVPSLGLDGRIDREILMMMDGKRTLEEIALGLNHRFPEEMPSFTEALNRTSALSMKYATS